MNIPEIHTFSIKAEPSPDHPHYYELQYGWLFLFLMAETDDSAQRQLSPYVNSLQFNLIDEEFCFYPLGLIPPPAVPFQFEFSEEEAMLLGRAHFFFGCEIGSDPGALILTVQDRSSTDADRLQ
jgi:hypothetical protein